MTSKKKYMYGAVLLILVVAGSQLFRLYRQPLGPTLDLPTVTQSNNPMLATFPVGTNAADSASTEIQQTATVTPSPYAADPQ